jgi:prophage antirepressor-like protein
MTAGGVQLVRALDRADVLRFIIGSTLPAAQRFERWVFEDVLSSIMTIGSYISGQSATLAWIRSLR